MKKYVAEVIGTFVLVFFGCGVAMLSGVDLVATALAFGLTIVAMAYTVGSVSGCHLNPAVSLAMFVNKRLSLADMIGYWVAQVAGAVLAIVLLMTIFKTGVGGMEVAKLGQNGFGEQLGVCGAFGVEVVLTFFFILVIVAVTGKKGSPTLAGLVIGLTLVLIHLLGIPLTGTSVNPARSLAPALLVGGEALSQVWVFIAAPLLGGALAALAGKFVLDTEK
jgi:aquaporin Z